MGDKQQKLPHHLVKVGKGAYLSKHDPRFLEKYIRFYPDDGEKLYKYAQALSQQGKHQQAQQYYHRAALNGYYGSVSVPSIVHTDNYRQESKKENKQTWTSILLWINVLLLILLLSLIGSLMFSEFLNTKKAMQSSKDDVQYTQGQLGDNEIAVSEIEEEYPIALLALNQAIQSYADHHGAYPEALEQLQGNYPENWVSILPAGVSYEVNKGDYELYWQGKDVAHLLPSLQLVFYQGSNELVLSAGKINLVTYSVASGYEALPFSTSVVQERVVNPNGGAGALGTRGLVLHNNYAIHGTNEPELIGDNISNGCLRLTNDHIESLYSYVPLGTPFVVEEGKPSEASVLSNGLPLLPLPQTVDEAPEGKLFNWKG